MKWSMTLYWLHLHRIKWRRSKDTVLYWFLWLNFASEVIAKRQPSLNNLPSTSSFERCILAMLEKLRWCVSNLRRTRKVQELMEQQRQETCRKICIAWVCRYHFGWQLPKIELLSTRFDDEFCFRCLHCCATEFEFCSSGSSHQYTCCVFLG